MRDTTKKLSGPQKDKFFERLYATQDGISASAASRLSQRTSDAVSSVHVRAKAYEAIRQAKPGKPAPEQAAQPWPDAAGAATPPPASAGGTPSGPAATAAAKQHVVDAQPAPRFDPYAFGLVPLYQKEGRDALLAKLTSVATADHLRQMARAQQVSLPADLRTGEATPDALRAAIADAVAKRIADRKAASG